MLGDHPGVVREGLDDIAVNADAAYSMPFVTPERESLIFSHGPARSLTKWAFLSSRSTLISTRDLRVTARLLRPPAKGSQAGQDVPDAQPRPTCRSQPEVTGLPFPAVPRPVPSAGADQDFHFGFCHVAGLCPGARCAQQTLPRSARWWQVVSPAWSFWRWILWAGDLKGLE